GLESRSLREFSGLPAFSRVKCGDLQGFPVDPGNPARGTYPHRVSVGMDAIHEIALKAGFLSQTGELIGLHIPDTHAAVGAYPHLITSSFLEHGVDAVVQQSIGSV